MIAAITGKFFAKSERGESRRIAPPLAKSLERIRVQKSIKDHTGEEVLSKMNTFIESMVSSMASGMEMVPSFDYLPQVFHELATAQVGQEEGVTPCLPTRNSGEYLVTMDMENLHFQDLSEADVSVVELDGEGRAMFAKELVFAAERAVISCHSCYHFADAQYMIFLVENPEAVPRVMKKGKGNLFVGTIITVGREHYVPMVTFLADGVSLELISLRDKLEDSAQFVIIERNR